MNDIIDETIKLIEESYRDYDYDIDRLEGRLYKLHDLLDDTWDEDVEEKEDLQRQIDEVEKELQALKDQQQKEYNAMLKNLPPPTNKKIFPGFDITETDPPYWSQFIPGNKDRDYIMENDKYTLAYIAEVTPEQYLELCSKHGWGKEIPYSLDNIINRLPDRDMSYLEEMVQALKDGAVFKLPYVDLKRHGQEGRHRALAAYYAGIKTIPCLIIG